MTWDMAEELDGKGRRIYRSMKSLDRIYFESVTTVLGHAYGHAHWTLKPAEWELDQWAFFRERGKVVHQACALLANRRLDWKTLDDDCLGFVQSFETWLTEFNPRILETEFHVVSTIFGFAGRLDLFCIIDGELWVIDLKTGRFDRLAGAQTAAYRMALRETGSRRIEKKEAINRGVLYLSDCDFRWEPQTGLSDELYFINALNVYRSARELGVW